MKYFLSLLYAGAINVRSFLYNYNILKTYRFNIPIISIGNITMGGAGKTPMVSWLVDQTLLLGKKPCVITRGYNRQSNELIVKSRNKNINPIYTVNQIGDEPYLLLKKHPNIDIIIGSNKIKAIKYAVNNLNVDLIIIDDGFQSIYIKRDLDIIMINSQLHNKKYYIFPYGMAREGYNSLERADIIIFTKNDIQSKSSVDIIEKFVNKKNIPTFKSKELFTLSRGDGDIALNEIQLKSMVGVCGIAYPQLFWSVLKKMGLEIKSQLIYKDHHNYTEDDMNNIYKTMLEYNTNTIITTSKDFDKINRLNVQNKEIIVLDMKLEIDNTSLLLKIISEII